MTVKSASKSATADASGGVLVVRTVAELRRRVAEARAGGLGVGLVPTMGALHAGHGRLIEACREVAGFVVVSIFVNPTQFAPTEDLARYPRTPEEDRSLCGRSGASLIFAPGVEDLYPEGAGACWVEVPGLSDVLEGASRPGHFRGVATVVLKLLMACGPDLAIFGRKDFQQLRVIRRMVADLLIPVRILASPTIREADGLAMSSRNRYLGPEEQRAAVVLSVALRKAIEAVRAGESDAGRVRQILRDTVESEPLARLDHAEVVDAETLRPLSTLGTGRDAVALLAARLGPARLIDNAALPAPGGATDAVEDPEK